MKLGVFVHIEVVLLSFFSLVFKWRRLLFILISFEFIMLCFFFLFSSSLSGVTLFFFICYSVVTSLFGLVIVIMNVGVYGDDLCIF